MRLLGSDLILDTGENTELGLDSDIELMCIVSDLLGEGDILLVREGRPVDHDGREAHVNAALADLERITVVQMEDNLRILPSEFLGILYSALCHVAKESLVCVVARTLAHLQDNRRLGLGSGLNDGLKLLHIVEIECRYRIPAFDCLGEHLTGVHQAQIFVRNHIDRLNDFNIHYKFRAKIVIFVEIMKQGMNSRKVVIFSAPSGAGKSTVVHHLLELHPEFEFSISATSRAPRGAEKDGVDYYFLDAEKFRELIAEDAFVEYEEVYRDRFYGTLKTEVERIWNAGHVIVFDVDVQGGYNLKRFFGDKAFSILILPPDLEILEQRLRNRGTDSEDAILERIGKAQSEIDFGKGKFDFTLVNDVLEDTFRQAEQAVNTFLEK